MPWTPITANFSARPAIREWACLFATKAARSLPGLVGMTYAGWLFVADLWVHADLRRRGIGTQLLELAETPSGRSRVSFRHARHIFVSGTGVLPALWVQALRCPRLPSPPSTLFFVEAVAARRGIQSVKLFPVSVKAVLFEASRVVLLENERRRMGIAWRAARTGRGQCRLSRPRGRRRTRCLESLSTKSSTAGSTKYCRGARY